MVVHPDVDEDKQTDLIEEASDLFLLIQLNMKDMANDKQLVKFQKLLKVTSEKNFKLYFSVNYKIAKRLFKKA